MELHCFQKMMFSSDDDTEKCLKKCLCLTVDYNLLKASPFAELLLLQLLSSCMNKYAIPISELQPVIYNSSFINHSSDPYQLASYRSQLIWSCTVFKR